MGKKSIAYPKLLDDFGRHVSMSIERLKRDSLKPTVVADIVDLYGAVFGMQQLLVMSYNLAVQNHANLTEMVFEAKKELEDLKTRIAGYSERINALNAELSELKKGTQIQEI